MADRYGNNTDASGGAGDPSYESIETLRQEIQTAFEAARLRVASRREQSASQSLSMSQESAKALLMASRRHAQQLLHQVGSPFRGRSDSSSQASITPMDGHTLDRLVSHVRHSIVRTCFYNLNLYCPSLVEEFDADLEHRLRQSLDQAAAVEAEIAGFFAQELSDGHQIHDIFPECNRECQLALSGFLRASNALVQDGFSERARQRGAGDIPNAIGRVMASLQKLQSVIDNQKVSINQLVDEAASLTASRAEAAGLRIFVDYGAEVKVFGDARSLISAFIELIENACRYAAPCDLCIRVQADTLEQEAVVTFQDDGNGMEAEDRAQSIKRGVSTGGTGEGLPMVMEIVEAQHLGQFELRSGKHPGLTAVVRLPLKLNIQKDNRNGEYSGGG